MNMKLSYRDKVIFIVAIVLIILVAGFFLLIKPKFAEIDTAKYNLSVKQQERADIDAKIATLPTIIENIKTIAVEIGEKQGLFLDEQDPYLNETYIREALPNVDIKSMNTNYTVAGNLSRYVVYPAHLLPYDNKMNADLYNELPQELYDLYNDVPSEVYPGVIIGTTTMDFTIASDLALRDAYNVIDRIDENEKAIILNTVETDTNELEGEENSRDVTYNITMYSIFPLNGEQGLQETDEIKPIEQPAE
ncbi:MAG: hypothetical protein K2H23_04980 [Oscillospiraceae bacterium]|nr:hypothetical protein [Oscillospiraceae bacterium]